MRSIVSNFFSDQDVKIWRGAVSTLPKSQYGALVFQAPLIEIADQKDPQAILTIAQMFNLGDGNVVFFHSNYWTSTNGTWAIFQPQEG